METNTIFFKTLSKNVTTAGTPVKLVSTPVVVDGNRPVQIKAKTANTGVIYIKAEGEINSYPLKAEEKIDLYVSDLSKIWLDSSVNAEGVVAIYYQNY
jgi:predicted amino acid dehydrogenase